MRVEWIEKQVLALMTTGVDVSLDDELAAFDKALAEPIRLVDPELAEQRRAMGIAV